MPIYEYKCPACEHKFEELRKHDDPRPAVCPTCAKEAVRLISLPNFELKGGGWAKDGYSG